MFDQLKMFSGVELVRKEAKCVKDSLELLNLLQGDDGTTVPSSIFLGSEVSIVIL